MQQLQQLFPQLRNKNLKVLLQPRRCRLNICKIAKFFTKLTTEKISSFIQGLLKQSNLIGFSS